MFELNKNHREALLEDLSKCNDKIESITNCINSTKEDDPKSTLLDWWDMDLFLEQNRKQLIEKSLIDNEIEF